MTFAKPLQNVWYVTVPFGAPMWYTPFHKGVDLRTRDKHFPSGIGMPIYAPADGSVARSGYDERGGKFLVLDHGAGYQTKYFHLSGFNKESGESVKEGEIIAYSGNTGKLTTAAHLHWELLINGKWVNPLLYLKDQEEITMNKEELYEEFRQRMKAEFVRKDIRLNFEPKDGSVWVCGNNKRYKFGTDPNGDIVILATMLAGETISEAERNYPITTNRKDVL